MGFINELWRIAQGDDEGDEYDEEMITPPQRKTERAERRQPIWERGEERDREREKEREPEVTVSKGKREVSKMRNNIVDITTNTNTKVVVVEPKKYGEVNVIAEYLRDKHTIFLNLERTDEDESCRILDFLAGVAYAVDGNVRKVASATYIITPFTVTLMDSLMDGLEKEGIFYKDDNKGFF